MHKINNSLTRNSPFYLVFIGQLLVRRDPWVDDKGFAVANVGNVTAHL